MADTQRLVSTLQGLFPSTGTGDIDAQDLRDLLVSAAPSYGHHYISSSAATTVSSSATWYEAAGTWALASGNGFSRQADNRLRYDGSPTYLGLIVAHFTITCGSSSQAARVGIAKNGSVLVGAEQSIYLGTSGSAPGSGALVALTTVATNDYLGLFVRNDTAGNNLTLTYGSLVTLGILK